MKFYGTLLICLMSWTAQAQTGVSFEHGSLDEALAKAADENKLVFVDAYTAWCGPCKKMNKSVFPDQGVGEYYNENFVNIKIDMEKGEGPDIAKKYGVRSYPTFLYLSSHGDVLHRVSGYRPPDAFIALGKEAKQPSKQLKIMERQYKAAGEDVSADLMRSYALTLDASNKKEAYEVGKQYLDKYGTAEGGHEDLVFALADRIDQPFLDLLMQNKTEYVRKFGKEAVEGKLKSAVSQHLYKNIKTISPKDAKKLAKKYLDPKEHASFMPRYEVYHALSEKDYAQVSEGLDELLGLEDFMDVSMLSSIAWVFDQRVDDPKLIEEALTWTQTWNEKETSYESLDALAHFQFKMGQVEEARLSATKALERAKTERKKDTATRELLHKINS